MLKEKYNEYLKVQLSNDDEAKQEFIRELEKHGVKDLGLNMFEVPVDFEHVDEFFVKVRHGIYRLKDICYHFAEVFNNNEVLYEPYPSAKLACFRVGGSFNNIMNSFRELHELLGLDMSLSVDDDGNYVVQVHPTDVAHRGYDTAPEDSSGSIIWTLVDAINGKKPNGLYTTWTLSNMLERFTGKPFNCTLLGKYYFSITSDSVDALKSAYKHLYDSYPLMEVRCLEKENRVVFAVPEIEYAINRMHGVYTDGKVVSGRRARAAVNTMIEFYSTYRINKLYDVKVTDTNKPMGDWKRVWERR